ncbi:MAG TPA: histidine phosphotransferase family protein [Rhodopila sp.]|uniref:histidine phosphotransferase family protein n=1 Tax=Rhodopila sp. TaxID=2480087 RepID=UPI002CDD0AB6|nr:histidine phosphotransferase family protein [Rhodopila sp.]HVY18303.1 histidine phosphotransferase family protein [Rhodopila sp.]
MIGVEAAIRIIELASMRLYDGHAPVPVIGPSQALRHAAWAPRSGALPLETVVSLAAGLPADVRLDTANLAPPATFAPGLGRVLLNLLLLGADSLPNGGTVALAGSAEDVFVRLAGAGAALPAGFAALLADDAAALTALQTETGLQGAFTVLLARREGLRLSLVMPPTRQPAPPILRLTA